jgi:alkaline phosphatase D
MADTRRAAAILAPDRTGDDMSTRTTRREFAQAAAAFGAALALGSGTAIAAAPSRERRDLYPQGVASGDPQADSVILWTRRAPDAKAESYKLTVEVASTPAFATIVARGETTVGPDTDWTCRFLAAGLKPGQEYWYRFTDEQGNGSRVGRTLTAPAESDPRPVKFAFVSCQDISQGACNAYRRMIFEDERRAPAERLLFVLHLGDFIYEMVWYPEDSPGGVERGRRLRDIVRFPNGEKMGKFHIPTSLADYRAAYKGYLTDPDLQDARARFPFVPVWDNHEFSWQAFQSQQVFNGEVRPAQKLKVIANQAWFEYQPARVVKPGDPKLDRFTPPEVSNAALTRFDALGLGLEPNNLTAINSLRVHRALRFGRNAELIITDNRSFKSPPTKGEGFDFKGFPFMFPEEVSDTLEAGRAANNGRPPATLRFDGKDVPNPMKDEPPQSYLGVAQKKWFLERLTQSTAPWKIWGHSFGTLSSRTDPLNLPPGLTDKKWPGQGYGQMHGGYVVDHAEIMDVVRDKGVTGLAIVAGDRHTFWAGRVSKALPPQKFEPLAVEFITGSISAQNTVEVTELTFPKNHPLRALYLQDLPGGRVAPAINMTLKHGVRASLELARTGDKAKALALSNGDVAPHLDFLDLGGNGYATMRVSPSDLETEFVCIQRPLERSATPDGGPLVYRVAHRVNRWRPGEAPVLQQRVVEGEPPLAM